MLSPQVQRFVGRSCQNRRAQVPQKRSGRRRPRRGRQRRPFSRQIRGRRGSPTNAGRQAVVRVRVASLELQGARNGDVYAS